PYLPVPFPCEPRVRSHTTIIRHFQRDDIGRIADSLRRSVCTTYVDWRGEPTQNGVGTASGAIAPDTRTTPAESGRTPIVRRRSGLRRWRTAPRAIPALAALPPG